MLEQEKVIGRVIVELISLTEVVPVQLLRPDVQAGQVDQIARVQVINNKQVVLTVDVMHGQEVGHGVIVIAQDMKVIHVKLRLKMEKDG